MNVGRLKPGQWIPDGFFVRGIRTVRERSGPFEEWFCVIRLPIYGMVYHDYEEGYCFSQMRLDIGGRSGFRSWWRPVPGCEWFPE